VGRTAKHLQQDDGSLDLVASGASGKWSVLIEETHTGPTKWFIQIEGPSIYFSFELLSINILDEVLLVLERPASAVLPVRPPGSQPKAANGRVLLGMNNRTRITLLRDDEYIDRCFLVTGSDSSPTVRYSISGTEFLKFIDALRQATEELKKEYGGARPCKLTGTTSPPPPSPVSRDARTPVASPPARAASAR